MKLQVEKINSNDHYGKSILIFGESGTGKSTLLGTLKGKTLIIDVEGGLSVLRGSKNTNIDRIPINESLDNLRDIFDALCSAKPDYYNVCLDSGTELEKFMLINLAKRGKNDGMPTLQDYGIVSFRMREYMRKLRDLRERGVNVIVTCLEMPLELEQSDSSIRTRMYPMLGRKLAPEVCGLFDMVGRLEVSTKAGNEGTRYIRLDGTESIIAKNRYGNGNYAPADLGYLFSAIDAGESLEAGFKKTRKE
jgi:phage nucleotide-binding protein